MTTHAGTRLRGQDLAEALPHRAEPPIGDPLHLHVAILAPHPATCPPRGVMD